jgi:hypothetical protein
MAKKVKTRTTRDMAARIQQLEQQLLIAKSVGMGLTSVLIAMSVAHTRLLGGEKERALLATRRVLDAGLDTISVNATTIEGEKKDISPDIRRRVKVLIDRVEFHSRRGLALAPKSSSTH